LGKFQKQVVKVNPKDPSSDVSGILRESKADLLINYLPVGSEKATRWYAQQALDAECGL